MYEWKTSTPETWVRLIGRNGDHTYVRFSDITRIKEYDDPSQPAFEGKSVRRLTRVILADDTWIDVKGSALEILDTLRGGDRSSSKNGH